MCIGRAFHHGVVVVMPEVQRKHQRRRNCFPKSDSTAPSRNSIIYLSLKSPSSGDLNAICVLSAIRCAAEPGGDAGSAGSPNTARSCPVQPSQRQQIASRSTARRWNRLRHAILYLARFSILRGPRQVVRLGSWIRNLVGMRMASSTTKIYTTAFRRPFYTMKPESQQQSDWVFNAPS